LLVLVYFAVSLAVSGSMVFRGLTWPGIALLIGSIISFAAGSGGRGGTYMGQRRSAFIIGVTLLFAGTRSYSIRA
jgi:hypothetical protein